MTKNERAYNLVFNKLNEFTSYEDKHKYLDSTIIDAGKHGKKSIKDLLNRYPELSQSVNEHMLNTAISEYGNPADKGFTFSKDVSNKKLLDILDTIAMNKEIIQTKYGGQEGYEILHQEVLDKKAKREKLEEERDFLQKGIASRRKEFSDRVGWSLAGPDFGNWDEEGFSGGDLLDIALGIPSTILFEGANIIQQIGAGWTDIGKEEGTEKVERANLVWDHENQRFGLGPEFKAQQDRLTQVLDKIELLSAKNQEYEDFENLDAMQDIRLAQISSTIIDDLVDSGYATEEKIRTLLGE